MIALQALLASFQAKRGHIPATLTRGLVTLSLALGLLAGLPAFALAASHDAPSPVPHPICAQTPLPPGWVIVDEWADWTQCGSPWDGPNVLAIAPPPTTQQAICFNSPLPSNFVITAEQYNASRCQKTFFQLLGATKTIAPFSNQSNPIDVCVDSPLPSGTTIVAEYKITDRPAAALTCGKGVGIIQKTFQFPTGNPMYVCADSPIPDGYQVVRNAYAQNCRTDNGASKLIAPQTTP
ncbi:hypothetical protein [Ktedonobacter racemifer]|uniref:Uncharacterized protein n=1 Tax=Ktedonobacter racemifer DSM 44963 TaxID=485913 RepID=D6U3Q6_KTERA|nr:hypothetical protein [Ktedonobacter racemifer]EFH83046.1 hypothetical protein Krac_3958 [Ktedonobacter racemifer DSM 44963]